MLANILPLNIFPEGSLANSIIVTVWVGVLVIAFFNLRFGWVLSGLVVPGYLVPLLLVKPIAVVVILFEALLTYLISLFICNKSASWFGLSHFFGRDRFLLLVLVSVFVRLLLDGFAFPGMLSYLESSWQIELSFQNDLHSFGLIIISLIANQIWKTGVLRGGLHLLVTLGLTFLIVKFVVVGLTNFSLANLSFMYEEISVAILASPKSYIILLLCCYLASRMNLLYGWEYSGILIPSLIALQWFFPQKILMTFIETFIILGLGSLLLKIPKVANMNIVGARKLVVFFSIGFIYKMGLAYFLEWYNPYSKISDHFAFGYLLSTLLALKIHDKQLLFHTSRATLQTSLVAVIFATLIGFGLTKIDFNRITASSNDELIYPIEHSDLALDDWLLTNKVELFDNKSMTYVRQASVTEIDLFSRAIKAIDEELQKSQPISEAALSLLNRSGYQLIELDSHLVLYPIKNKNWGVFAFSKDSEAYPLLVSTPRGLDEELAYDAAFSLSLLLDAKYLAIATSPFKKNEDGSSDNLINPNTYFSFFQKTLSNNNVLQVRTSKRNLPSVAKRFSHLVTSEAASYLWITGNLRSGFDLNELAEITQQPELIWATPDFFNQQRDSSQTGFVELLISPNIANRLKVLAGTSHTSIEQLATNLSIEGYLNDLAFTEKSFIAGKLTNLYQAPANYESLFFHQEIIAPLLELVDESQKAKGWTQDIELKLQNLNLLASMFNYKLSKYKYIRNNREYLILSEQNTSAKRYWGTYIFSLDSKSQKIVEVPRPLMELGTFEYGLYLFGRLDAKALLIAGSHPNANSDGKSDVLDRFNHDNIFNVVHYSIFNHYRNDFMQALLIRSMGFEDALNEPDLDIILSENNNLDNHKRSSLSLSETGEFLSSLSLNYRIDDPNKGVVSKGTVSNSLINLLRYQSNKQIITHWISPKLNDHLKQNEEQWLSNKHFLAAGIKTEFVDAPVFLKSLNYIRQSLEPSIVESVDKFIQTDNIVYLLKLVADKSIQLKLVADFDSKQTLLLLKTKQGVLAVRNLNGINVEPQYLNTNQDTSINNFLSDRNHWLFAGEMP